MTAFRPRCSARSGQLRCGYHAGHFGPHGHPLELWRTRAQRIDWTIEEGVLAYG